MKSYNRCIIAILRSVLLIIPAVIGLFTVCSLTGMVVFAYFTKLGCDPLANKDVANPNQVGFTTGRALVYTSLRLIILSLQGLYFILFRLLVLQARHNYKSTMFQVNSKIVFGFHPFLASSAFYDEGAGVSGSARHLSSVPFCRSFEVLTVVLFGSSGSVLNPYLLYV